MEELNSNFPGRSAHIPNITESALVSDSKPPQYIIWYLTCGHSIQCGCNHWVGQRVWCPKGCKWTTIHHWGYSSRRVFDDGTENLPGTTSRRRDTARSLRYMS